MLLNIKQSETPKIHISSKKEDDQYIISIKG